LVEDEVVGFSYVAAGVNVREVGLHCVIYYYASVGFYGCAHYQLGSGDYADGYYD